MIVRHALWQHGRRAAWKSRSFGARVRQLSTPSSSTENINAPPQQSDQELHHIEPSLNRQSHQDGAVQAPIDALFQNNGVAENYLAFKKQQELYKKLGSSISPHYHPRSLVNDPPSPSDITLELLLASQTHLGHSTSLWNPANARYIHGIRQGIHIISLEATAAHLRRACRVVTEVARRGGLILFVGTRDGQERCVVKAAELSGGCHLFEKWIPGSITNAQQILGHCSTKVVDELDQDVTGFEEQLRDRAVLRPDLVVCLNPMENKVLLSECSTNQIPSIGVIDTDANPTWVTYPIPANDDSLRSVQVICGILGRAGEEGRKRRLEAARNEKITFVPAEGLKMPGQDGSEGSADAAETWTSLGYRPKEE